MKSMIIIDYRNKINEQNKSIKINESDKALRSESKTETIKF
jgi:hypothetical protein